MHFPSTDILVMSWFASQKLVSPPRVATYPLGRRYAPDAHVCFMFEVFRHFKDTSKMKSTKSCLHLLMDGSHEVWWPLTQASTARNWMNEHLQVPKVKRWRHWTFCVAVSAFWPSEAPASLHQKRRIPSAWPPASPWRHPKATASRVQNNRALLPRLLPDIPNFQQFSPSCASCWMPSGEEISRSDVSTPEVAVPFSGYMSKSSCR